VQLFTCAPARLRSQARASAARGGPLPRGRVVLGAVLVLLCLLWPSLAAAQPSDADRSAAREMGAKAVEEYNAGQYEAALDHFQRAHDIVGLTTTGLYIARTLEKLNRWVEASERYLEVTRMQLPPDAEPKHIEAKETAAAEREALMPRIPKLTIEVRGVEVSAAQVTLDGKPVPAALLGVALPADPGAHELVATERGRSVTESVTLAEADAKNVVLDLGVAPPPPDPVVPKNGDEGSSALLTVGWVAVAVGGAGLLVGAITGGLAVGKRGDLEDSCLDKQCPPEFHDDVDSYNTLRVVSGIGLIGGGVIAAAGIVMVVVSLTGDSEEGTALRIGPSGVSLVGSF
jgi:hypothetical protein